MSAELVEPETTGSPDASIGLRVRAMAGDRLLEELVTGGDGRVMGERFAMTATSTGPEGIAGRRDVSLEVECIAEEPVEAGLVVALPLPGAPGEAPRWLIPGLFYGENRPAACRRLYPRFAPGPPIPAELVSDHWTFRIDRAASQVVFGWSGDHGVALAAWERGPLGLPGVGFAAGDATGAVGTAHEIRLAFPFREEPAAYDGSEVAQPPVRSGHAWQPGERATIGVAVYDLAADPYAFVPVLRDLHARLAVEGGVRPWVGIEEAADLAATGLLRWHYRDTAGGVLYETAAFERPAGGGDAPGDRAAMHVGWLSGVPAAAALLRHGRRCADGDAVEAGARVIDTIVANPAPCGTLWGQWSEAEGWGKGWTPGEHRLHGRTIGEAVTFLLRAIAAEAVAGEDRASWRDVARANLAFVTARQRADGALPATWHGITGEPASWAGSAALAWVPPLLAGADLLGEPRFADAARRVGSHYAPFVERGFLHGAPEDVDLAPSSEDGYLAVMAYVALLEATDTSTGPATGTTSATRDAWLRLARLAAEWTLTFRYTWNVAFDPHTILAQYDVRTLGADQASPANQHLHAYGLICLPEMVRLAGHTGDDHYMVRTRENLACFRQLIARTDGDFNAMRGMAPERLYQTACFGPKGAIGALSHAWVLGLLLNACEEALDHSELADG